MKNKIIPAVFISIFLNGVFAEKMTKYSFYNSLYELDLERVRNHLENGFNSNECKGEARWVDSNPLRVVSEKWFSSYDFIHNDVKNIAVFPDVEIIKILVEHGADINRLPYIWNKIWRWNNDTIKDITKNLKNPNSEVIIDCFINDHNRVLRVLLENGANPNLKGHPYPFGKSRWLLFFTDKKAFKYFNSPEATTPLYEAIKKGMVWESQVDLLLEYGAILDESCLEAAKQSGDEAMFQKIEKLLQSRKS
ncbi:MAG: hypothetical protein IJ530_15515 [Treponema sp.]|uniref:hypothetical protein n=1 Tax=Treponema sp. TaxID=166 RepID=UPI0025CDA8C8|nr:hypothetical protein [Treponema sp.]MBQ8681139.1 hypothetical protein [Treponema sp.]